MFAMIDCKPFLEVDYLGMLRPTMDPLEAQALSALQETVVQQRAAALQREAVRLARQRAFLREERRKARQEEAAVAEEAAALEHVKKADWWPERYFKGAGTPGDRLKLRVGGQDFEVAKEVLCQDESSLLFALCQDTSPVAAQGGGSGGDTVVVDRDWWLFRFVVTFLRDGLIPEDRSTALQLYREAAFWRLGSLQRAIEEAHLNLTRVEMKVDDATGLLEEGPMDEGDAKFWKARKNWWEAAPPEEKKKEKKKADWWTAGPGEDDEKHMTEDWGMSLHRGTWGYGSARGYSR